MKPCPSCGETMDEFDVLVGEGSHEIDWTPCCEYGREAMLADLPRRTDLGCRMVEGEASWQGVWNLELRPLGWRDACEFIAKHHKHHDPPRGWKVGFACWNGPTLVGVVVLGRPVSRVLAARNWLEVTRLCTTGHPELRKNAATKLYAAARRAARRLKAERVCTYTLETETAHSLKAAGWERTHLTRGGSWNCQSRPRTDKHPTCRKYRWEIAA